MYVICWLFLESSASGPMCAVCCVNMLWNCSFRGTWPVGRLPPTLMCICWSVVGSECPDRLAMDFGGAGAAQQGLTDSCQSGGGIGCTENGERWDLTGLCPDRWALISLVLLLRCSHSCAELGASGCCCCRCSSGCHTLQIRLQRPQSSPCRPAPAGEARQAEP